MVSLRLLSWVGLALSLMVSPVLAADVVNGLNAEYFSDRDFGKLVVKQIEPNIAHSWNFGRPHPQVGTDNFSVRWSGWIKAPQAGRYRLILQGNDGSRLYLDGLPVVDAWRAGHQHESASVELSGKPQQLKIEHFEIDQDSWMTFWWQPLGAERPAIVPSDVLFPDEESAKAKGKKKKLPAHGLVADYFDVDAKRHYVRDVVYRTEAVWGDWTAHTQAPVDGTAKYSGFLVPEKSGRYQLMAYADNRVRVWIDEKPVVEANLGQEAGLSSAFVELKQGEAYPLLIEYTDSGHWGSYYLHWIPPETTDEVPIPTSLLFPNKQALPKDVKIQGK